MQSIKGSIKGSKAAVEITIIVNEWAEFIEKKKGKYPGFPREPICDLNCITNTHLIY